MCGRFTYIYTWKELTELISLSRDPLALSKRYNVAPSQQAPVMRIDAQGKRRLDMLRWGLIPFWAKDKKIGFSLINARSESLSEKPAFRDSFRNKRCLVPISGFYEWQKTPGKTQKKAHYISAPGNKVLFVAGLWDRWEQKTKEGVGEVIESFTIITTPANQDLTDLHDRMPAILSEIESEKWLDPKTPLEELRLMLKPYTSSLVSYQVSSRVNKPSFDDMLCIEPIRNGEDIFQNLVE